MLFYSSLFIFVIISTNGFPIAKDIHKKNAKPYENFELVEGDMLFPNSFGKEERGVLRRGNSVAWTNGIIPYEIAPGYQSEQRIIIIETMEKMQRIIGINNTICIQFRPRVPSDLYYIIITNGRGCSSYIGQNTGISMSRTVTLQHPGCVYEGIIMHELLHALGFFHEQSRPDRDDYIRVNYENIYPGLEHNFEKYNNTVVDTQNTPYDYGSLMHYGSDAFSSNGLSTIEPLLPNITIGQRERMSDIDIEEVRLFYQCQSNGITFPPTTTSTTVNLYTVNTSISSELTRYSPSFTRFGGSGIFYFESFTINVPTAGEYVFFSGSSMDTYGYVYSPSFSPSYPAQNLIYFNDDSGSSAQFKIIAYLQSDIDYTLVATTYNENVIGLYNVTISGLMSTQIVKNNESYYATSRATTETQRTTTTTTHSITSNYISTPAGYTSNYTSALTLSSPTFSRPGSSGAFFYEVIELSVFITGVYSLRSETMVDTYGYLYEYYFNPRNPEFNLLARDDDSGGRAQFLINYGLHSDTPYFLVFTTYSPNVIASFSVVGTGPYVIYYSRLDPPTTTTTTTTTVSTRPTATYGPIIPSSASTIGAHHLIMLVMLNLSVLVHVFKFF